MSDPIRHRTARRRSLLEYLNDAGNGKARAPEQGKMDEIEERVRRLEEAPQRATRQQVAPASHAAEQTPPAPAGDEVGLRQRLRRMAD